MKKLKTACILNGILALMELIACVWMFTGFSLTGKREALTSEKWEFLRYFTVDSNILMGVFAAITAVYQGRVLRGKREGIPAVCDILNLTGTVGVTLTMLVVVFFLMPVMHSAIGWFGMFLNSNFLFHLLCPLMSIIIYLVFEKSDRLRLSHVFAAMIPMGIYAVYYITVTLKHMQNGRVEAGYDWYYFFSGGMSAFYTVLPAMLLGTFLISYVLFRLNRKKHG